MTEKAQDSWSVDLDAFDLGEHYKLTRERITALVSQIDDAPGTPVPACPTWSVHDVVAHLTAIVEDVMAGRLTGPPSEELTAEQVQRGREISTEAMLAQWSEMAPTFEGLLSQVRVWPGFLDVLAHEHDIRGAVGVAGDREGHDMRAAGEYLLFNWEPPVPVLVRIGDGEYLLDKSELPGGGTPIELETTYFETFRVRLGRRSSAQLRAMSWMGDPTPVLDGLTIFGPEPYDVIE
jgi:uncharacterized protein (TIGR03083 family)